MGPSFLGELNKRFRVRRLLGTGGMSIVLDAHDERLGRDVAVKLVRCGPGAEGRARRLLREARVVSGLRSRHVVRVLDCGWLDAHSPFIVMELLNGRDLESVLRSEGPMSFGRALRCMIAACEALVEAHAAGIIHRDLKPSNLFAVQEAGAEEIVKVLDFGLAKALDGVGASTNLTRTQLLGTPRYMAPEQIACKGKLDERVDVWSAAITLHELITGRIPFDGNTREELWQSILTSPPRRLRSDCPDAPLALETLLLWSLQKRQRDRVPNMTRFRDELERILAHAPVDHGLPAGASRTRKAVESTPTPSSITATYVPVPERERVRSPTTISLGSILRSRSAWLALATGALIGFQGSASLSAAAPQADVADAALPADEMSSSFAASQAVTVLDHRATSDVPPFPAAQSKAPAARERAHVETRGARTKAAALPPSAEATPPPPSAAPADLHRALSTRR
jgi:eukaryotic-like serine/threonine-protein kinase